MAPRKRAAPPVAEYGWRKPRAQDDPWAYGWKGEAILSNDGTRRKSRAAGDMRGGPDEFDYRVSDDVVPVTPDLGWLSAPWDPAIDGYDATPNVPRPVQTPDSGPGTAPPAPEPAPVAVPVAPEGFGAADGQPDGLDHANGGEAAPGDELAHARAELVRLGVLVPNSWGVAA